MSVNKHIQQLDYPEYARDFSGSIRIDLSHHLGRSRELDYVLSQDKELIQKISSMENLREENVLITGGADEGLHHIAETFLEKGKTAVIPIPSFGRFEFHTKVVGAGAIFVKHTKFPYSFDLKLIAKKAQEKKADLIFLANPNNPTGEVISKKRLRQFIKDNSDRIVVIDEVSIEGLEDSTVSFVNQYRNLIIVKSFSKIFRAPGLRIGYILADPDQIKMLGKTVSPYEISSLSLAASKKILFNNKKYLFKAKTELIEARNLLKKDLPLSISHTQASVALIYSRKNFSLYDYLLKHGILPVDGKNFRGLEKTNSVRIIITNQEDMRELIRITKKYQSL